MATKEYEGYMLSRKAKDYFAIAVKAKGILAMGLSEMI